MLLRLFLTFVITVVIIVFVANALPGAKSFFDDVKEKLPILDIELAGLDVEKELIFELSSNKHANIDANAQKINITFSGKNLSLQLKEGKIEGDKTIKLYEYSGPLEINGSHIMIDGFFEKLELPELFISFSKSNVKLDSDITQASIDGIELAKLDIEKIDGNIKVRDLDININQKDISIKDFFGSISYAENFEMNGVAGKIDIPGVTVS